MADQKQGGIAWTDATWNPLRGCTRVSDGCRNCYAETIAARFSAAGMPYEGVADPSRSGSKWTGKVTFAENMLDQPLRWKRPRRIFVNSMSDLFHESVPFQWRDRIFDVMARAPQHTFQVLTKRPHRMANYCNDMRSAKVISPWPLPNVWLGVSVENQATADERIPWLLKTPATVRFLSCEPLLGELNIPWFLDEIDWVIVGGESGAGARPMHPRWARNIRDQCAFAGVPFFFKQWGDLISGGHAGNEFYRVGKKAAGSLLDGVEHKKFPA